MSNVLVTGGTGFIGTRLVPALLSQGHEVFCFARDVVRAKLTLTDSRITWFVYDFASPGELPGWFDSIDVVIHLAGLAHGLGKQQHEQQKITRVNIDGAVSLAKAAIASNLKQFVYVSTVKVHGEHTGNEVVDAFAGNSALLPVEQYARSKAEAEMALRIVAKGSSTALTVLRPPLVYGPGVKANFHNFMKLVDRGVPLPFAGLSNKRSMVFVDNLVSAIMTIIENPKAYGGAFLVKDVDLSTPELATAIANAMDKKNRFFKLPPSFLNLLFTVIGARAKWQKLNSSLLLDDSATRDSLNWTPPVSFETAIGETVNWYLENK